MDGKLGTDPPATPGLRSYPLFGLFGSGSGWLIISALFLQSPVYLDRFGRKAMNRMTIGYNLGTLCLALFVGVRAALRFFGREVSYPALITAVSVGNAVALVIAASGVTTIETLMFVSFLGGTFGWLSGIIHYAHLTMRYQNVFTAVFSTGDAGAAVFVAILALVQRPELGSEGWRFSPTLFYFLCLPFVILALFAFWYIERTRLGALPVDLEESATTPLKNFRPGSDVELAALPLKEGTDGSAELGDNGSEAVTFQQDSQRQSLLRFARGRMLFTAALMFLVFFEGITCWGFGDSLIPYACAHASPADDGKGCVFQCSFSTVFAVLAGAHAATIPAQPKMYLVCVPMLVYIVVFTLFCLAATSEGRWANPFVDSEAKASGGDTVYVVSLVFAVRSLAPFMRSLAQRLIQTTYEPSEFEAMNAVLLWTGVAANVGGTVAVTTIIERS